jgi:four helix bundle protein
VFLVEKLRVYQKALSFGDAVIRATSESRGGPVRSLTDQILRASSSIAANIAEGNGRWAMQDRKRFFHIARGSLLECLPILHFLKTAGALSPETHQALRDDAEVISKMLNGLIAGRKEEPKATT